MDACPVNCIYGIQLAAEVQAYINNDECIDCDACVSECPTGAIYEESELPEEFFSSIRANWVESNRIYASGKLSD
jgi:NAD-dependent dihydropyrimidine dehydrogenase PreA subunit